MTLATAFAEFIVSLTPETLPAAVTEKARVCVLNGFGVALGGLSTPYAPLAAKAALAIEGEITQGATLLADGRKTSVAGAVLSNVAQFHSRAQEDASGGTHFGVVVIPLITALMEAKKLPLSRFIPAIVAGYEIGSLLERVYVGHTTPYGLRGTPLYGTIAAAAAASKALGLNVEQTAAALSNAVSFTGGALQSLFDGTDEWRYQPGVAAQNGLTAAALAQAGSVSAPHAFEGPKGFARVFARTDCNVAALTKELGKDWGILQVMFKPHPVCAFNQSVVKAALAVRDRVSEVERITVRMNPFELTVPGLLAKGPYNTISNTLLSVRFCAATAIAHGAPTLRAMTSYGDPKVAALDDRIEVTPDEGIPALSCSITVDNRDGTRIEHHQRMTAKDFDLDRANVAELIRKMGRETGTNAAAYDRLEIFVDGLPNGTIDQLTAIFAPAWADGRSKRQVAS